MSKKVKKAKKPRVRQPMIDPEMDESIPEIDDAAEDFHEAKRDMKTLKETSETCAVKLVKLMRDRKFKTYKTYKTYKTPGGIVVSLKEGKEKITVRHQTNGGAEHEFIDELATGVGGQLAPGC